MRKIALFVIGIALTAVTIGARADRKPADIPVKGAPLAQLFASDFRKLSIDPTSIKRGLADTFTIIVYNSYTAKAREAGLVPDNVAASSGRVEIDCNRGTYRVVSDLNLDASGKVIGVTGDAGASGAIKGNEVVAEIAGFTCVPGTAAARGNAT